LTPRWNDIGEDPVGVATIEVLEPINYEAVGEGRAKTARRLAKEAARLAANPASAEACRSLMQEIRDDDYGLSAWYFVWEGRTEEPFASLQAAVTSAVWRRLVRMAYRQQT
jgi:hypothetical protein